MSIYRTIGIAMIGLMFAGCSPRVATSFWRIGTPADSVRESYAVLYEGQKMRHCYPITEWTDTLPNYVGKNDTYHSLHHHGVAVESELMAYRIYFDKKQTIDPYCKRTPQLELAQSYWYPNDSLLAAGYGDDILRVSGTVGVGSVKYWQTADHQSTVAKGLFRHIEPVAERSQRIVSRSRSAATIEVAVKDWLLPLANSDSTLAADLTVQYTLRAGHRDMRCDVFCSDTLSGLCTGVQAIPAKAGLRNILHLSGEAGPTAEAGSCAFYQEFPNGILLGSWGTDWPVNDSAKYAKETVGLAVFIPRPYAGAVVHDKQNLLSLLRLTDQANPSARRPEMPSCHFYLTVCGATKENHPVASSAKEWYLYLRHWVQTLR